MARLRVVLVEPKYEGNIGFIARAMANFDVDDLVLVNPPKLGDEARARAMAGLPILEKAKIVKGLGGALAGANLVVGTSGISTSSEKKFHRIAHTPKELAAKLAGFEGTAALVFGREDYGLLNEELRRCDLLVTIPSGQAHPILNVSHAAAIILYELHAAAGAGKPMRLASDSERERLHRAFTALMELSRYPEHKRERSAVMIRRLLGRAGLSRWEYHALMGVLTRAMNRIERGAAKRLLESRRR